jgi:protein-tyrosine-phosphatase
MSDKGTRENPFNVLFLCTGNSARSIMAEAIMNRFGAPKFKAYSAGSQPKGEVNPHTIALLKSLNYKTDEYRSKNWEEFAQFGAPALDFVFTVCDNAANEVCPVWPGQPMSAHWGVPDPANAIGPDAVVAQAFADALRMLQNRITIFCALPISSIDRLSLQKKIEDIGKMRRDPSAEGAA